MTTYNNKHIESFFQMDDQFLKPFCKSSTLSKLSLNPLAFITFASTLLFLLHLNN
jgi:hypothetical protein